MRLPSKRCQKPLKRDCKYHHRLVAMPGCFVEQLEQVKPEPAVPENRAHQASPAVSWGQGGWPRWSKVTGADRVVTVSLPAPAPSVPATVFEPGLRAHRRP